MIRRLKEATLLIVAAHVGYLVWSPEYKGIHAAFTRKGALEWAACYDDAVIVQYAKHMA